MGAVKTFREQIDAIEDFVDLGTVGEEFFNDGYYMYERFKDDNFTAEDKAVFRGALLHIAERLKEVANNIQ